MTFTWPLVLVALLVVPGAIAGYVLVERRRERTVSRWGNPALFPYAVAEQPGRRRHLPVALLLLALTALLVGAARPNVRLTVAREDATVMLAVDTSFSMAARDVRPTRLAAARSAALSFMDAAPDKLNIGLVSFETGAHLVVPPTTDRQVLTHGLAALHPGEGTALGDAVRVALDAAGAKKPGVSHRPVAILLLSDGAQTQGRTTPAAAARRARSLKVPIYTVVLGTPGGIVERPLAGGLRERIQVPPDPAALRGVAQTSGGLFFAAADARSVRTVYQRLASRLGHTRARREVTAAFAGLGGLLMLGGAALSALWFRRVP